MGEFAAAPLAPQWGSWQAVGLTEGVWYDEWQQLKVTNDTPFAAIAALPPKGAARVCTNSPWCVLNGILRTAGNPSGAVAPPQPCIKQLYAVEDGYTC